MDYASLLVSWCLVQAPTPVCRTSLTTTTRVPLGRRSHVIAIAIFKLFGRRRFPFCTIRSYIICTTFVNCYHMLEAASTRLCPCSKIRSFSCMSGHSPRSHFTEKPPIYRCNARRSRRHRASSPLVKGHLKTAQMARQNHHARSL